MTRNVLVIEDEQEVAKLVKRHLEELSCAVKLAYDGVSGLREAESRVYDLILLDLMLPGIDGLEICRRLRMQSKYTPILVLTAKSTEVDRVLGLEMGADDYLTKPFSVAELVARVKAIFRRIDAFTSANTASGAAITVDDITIDPEKREVVVRGRNVDLTSKEFELLLYFMQNPRRAYSRAQLLDMVWGYSHEGYEHAINCHINRLRAKIEENHATPKYLLTVWGFGYKFSGGDPPREA